MFQTRQPNRLQNLSNAPVNLFWWQADLAWPEGQLFPNRQVEDLVIGILVSVADMARHFTIGDLARITTVYANAAFDRLENPVKVLHERGLSGPVLADQGHKFSAIDVQTDSPEDPLVRVIAIPKVPNLDEGSSVHLIASAVQVLCQKSDD